MAAEKGLNPEASAYIPRSLTCFLSILPTLSPITTPCCYFSPPPQPPPDGSYNFYTTFSSSSSSSFYAPLDLYTASYPQHPNSFPPPSTAAEAPSSPTVLIKEQAAVGGLVHEKVRRRTSRKGFGRSGFWKKVVGKREGCGYGGGDDDDRQHKAKFGNGKDRFLIHQKRVGSTSTTTTRPHHKVLPLTSDEPKTTIMIKNVPNKYSRALLLKFLDQHCLSENQRINEDNDACEEQIVSAFDFIYLPMDFKTGCNKGYAFVNFTEPRAVWKFYHAFHNKSWDFFQSPKIREIVCAKIQGKEALVHHFEKSTFRCDSDEFLPVCFSPARDGSGKWVKQRVVGERM